MTPATETARDLLRIRERAPHVPRGDLSDRQGVRGGQRPRARRAARLLLLLLRCSPRSWSGIALRELLPARALRRPDRGHARRRRPAATSSRSSRIRSARSPEGNNGGILTFGLLAALWSSSAAVMGLIDALNRAYDIEEGRPWWKVRLLAARPDARAGGVHPGRVRAGPRRADGRRVHRAGRPASGRSSPGPGRSSSGRWFWPSWRSAPASSTTSPPMPSRNGSG